MKRKLMIGAVSAAVILGGAIAAGAAKNELQKVELGSNSNSQKMISHDEAIKIALTKAEGYVESVELEKKNGKSYFEVEIENKDKEVEVRIDAKKGEVLSINEELDDDDNDVYKNETQAKNYISVQKAIQISEKEVNGKVIEVNLDDDDNQAKYEIELKTGKGEAEIELDAVTGKVLMIEHDDQDNNDLDD